MIRPQVSQVFIFEIHFLIPDIALNRTINRPSIKQFNIISPKVLHAEIQERLCAKQENLSSSLVGVLSVSIAVDVWSTRQRTFMSVIANWIDSTDFRRISNIISCDVFQNPITSQFLVERLQFIYSHNELTDKIVATVTNNHQQHETDNEIDDVTHLQLDELENRIQNPTHLFESIGQDDAHEALNDALYAELYRSAFHKIDSLREHSNDGNLSECSSQTLNELFNHSWIGSKFENIFNGISSLVNGDRENLDAITTELKISSFTETDMQFLKEYVSVMEPIATAIEYLQKNNCFYATLLPMVYSMKENLLDLQNRGEVQLCQVLLVTVVNAVEKHFSYLFDFDNDKCVPAVIATCTHPFFKMRWLKGASKTPANTNRIIDVLVQAVKKHNDGNKKARTDPPTSSNDGEFQIGLFLLRSTLVIARITY